MNVPIEKIEVIQEIEQTAQVVTRRQEIIDSVLTRGLVPGINISKGRKRYFGSGDSRNNRYVYGNTLHPIRHYKFYYKDKAEEIFHHELDYALYASVDSTLPVMMERKEEDSFWVHPANPKRNLPSQDISFLERRISSCFLVIAEYDYDTMGGSLRRKVKPESFHCLVFPQEIWEEYQSRGKVPQTPVLVTSGSIYRPILGQELYKSMKVPDFETPILEVLGEKVLQKTGGIWISGVRLPIIEDFQT